MKKLMMSIAMLALAALVAIPAFAQDIAGDVNEDIAGDGNDDRKVTICHFPPGNPANAHLITISENAVQRHIDRHGDFVTDDPTKCPGEGPGPIIDPPDKDKDKDKEDDDRDRRDRDRNNNNGGGGGGGGAAFEASQEGEQETESGDIDQSIEVSQTGSNSNQCVAPQGVANTGNAQTQLDLLQGFSTADDFEFDEVGSDIGSSPVNTTTCTQAVEQAAVATG